MPAVRACSTPLAPNSTPSTAFVSERHIQTTSTPSAASAGETALRAPSTSLPGLRFQTETSCPALTRLVAIQRPIIPKPKKATRIEVIPSRTVSFEVLIINRVGTKRLQHKCINESTEQAPAASCELLASRRHSLPEHPIA